MDSTHLGANIKKYRIEKGYTQEHAAELCGLSLVYFRQIEQGHKTPRLETFLKIAEMLETPTDKLLSGNISWTEQVQTYEIIEKLSQLSKENRQEALSLLDFHIELLKKR